MTSAMPEELRYSTPLEVEQNMLVGGLIESPGRFPTIASLETEEMSPG